MRDWCDTNSSFDFQIFSGLLVNLETLGKWISWAKYLSVFSYSMKALQINEFNAIDFYINTTIPALNRTVPVNW